MHVSPHSLQVQLTAGQVPYAQHYGIAEKPLSIKGYLGAMDKYLPRLTAVLEQQQQARTEDDASAAPVDADRARLLLLRRILSNQSAIDALRLPHYVFDGQIEQKLEDFDEELLGGTNHGTARLSRAMLVSYCQCEIFSCECLLLPGRLAVGRGEVPDYLINYDPVLTQFNLGPALTGAQPHFHGDAWNGLVYGRKQWFISPPSRAFFARSGQRVIDWLATPPKLAELAARDSKDGAQDGIGSAESDLLCVQEAGDVVYLPRLWGHAVLNLAQSVGAAVEFEQQ